MAENNPKPAEQPAPAPRPMMIDAGTLAEALQAKRAPVMPAVGADEAPEGGQVFIVNGRKVNANGEEVK